MDCQHCFQAALNTKKLKLNWLHRKTTRTHLIACMLLAWMLRPSTIRDLALSLIQTQLVRWACKVHRLLGAAKLLEQKNTTGPKQRQMPLSNTVAHSVDAPLGMLGTTRNTTGCTQGRNRTAAQCVGKRSASQDTSLSTCAITQEKNHLAA